MPNSAEGLFSQLIVMRCMVYGTAVILMVLSDDAVC